MIQVQILIYLRKTILKEKINFFGKSLKQDTPVSAYLKLCQNTKKLFSLVNADIQ